MITQEKDLESVLTKLESEGLLDAEKAQHIRSERAEGQFIPVVKYVLEFGQTNEDKLLEFVSENFGYPAVHLWKMQIHKDTVALIPKELAVEKQLLPVCRIEDSLTVAMIEPWDQQALEEVRNESGCTEICPVYVSPSDFADAGEKWLGENYETELLNVIEEMEGAEMELIDSVHDDESQDKSILLSLTDQEPVVRLTKSILTEGVKRKASDIFIEPHEDELVIRYRVDGVLQDGPHPPRSMHQGVISRLKIISDLDIAEQRLPQDGRLKIKVNKRSVEFRLSTIPSYFGEKACLRILDPESMSLDLRSLGYDDRTVEIFENAANNPYGMILVCGPTGSGKTTTLYSVLNYLDTPYRNLVTVEDPVEYHIDGINQVNVRTEVGLTFGASLRSILRQDPDVVLVGEIRDQETVDIAVKAALTGHIVLSTLHTNSAVGTITRLMNMGVEPFLLTAALLLVGSQRLMRKLCNDCKEGFKPEAEHFKAMNIEPTEVTIYKAAGCANCKDTGYKGRLSVVELLPISPVIRELILRRANEHELKSAARKEGMQTLREAAVIRVLSGETSMDEAFRVTMKDDDD